jgi:hypothetical protein
MTPSLTRHQMRSRFPTSGIEASPWGSLPVNENGDRKALRLYGVHVSATLNQWAARDQNGSHRAPRPSRYNPPCYGKERWVWYNYDWPDGSFAWLVCWVELARRQAILDPSVGIDWRCSAGARDNPSRPTRCEKEHLPRRCSGARSPSGRSTYLLTFIIFD